MNENVVTDEMVEAAVVPIAEALRETWEGATGETATSVLVDDDTRAVARAALEAAQMRIRPKSILITDCPLVHRMRNGIIDRRSRVKASRECRHPDHRYDGLHVPVEYELQRLGIHAAFGSTTEEEKLWLI
jgi:hypothetical protein